MGEEFGTKLAKWFSALFLMRSKSVVNQSLDWGSISKVYYSYSWQGHAVSWGRRGWGGGGGDVGGGESESENCSVTSDSLRLHWLISPWNSGQNTGVGSLSLLQGIFPTQGSNPGLLHCRQILYQLSGKPTGGGVNWKKHTIWELWVRFYLGQNEDCSTGIST